MTRPTSDTSTTMHHIFTLKCSTPSYAVQFFNTFCHFTNSIVAKFYDQMPFLMPADMMMGPSIFIETPSLAVCQSRLKSDSPAHEMETASCQAPNWYFKVSGIIKTQILFNPLVIKIQILSLDRLNSLNASHCPHIETSQLICSANQLTGLYMKETLTFNELNKQDEVHRFTNLPLVTSLPTISAAFISQDLCVM